jgi:hypothetical protein
MDDASTQSASPAVDERWLADWVEFGFVEIDHYLRRQAEFEAYLRLRRAADEL